MLHDITANVVFSANGIGRLTNSTISWSGATVPNFETDLLAGTWYINVHAALNPGGEIQGNLVSAPEPTSLFVNHPIRYRFSGSPRFENLLEQERDCQILETKYPFKTIVSFACVRKVDRRI